LIDSIQVISWLTLGDPVRRCRSMSAREVSQMDELLATSRSREAGARGVVRTAIGILLLLGGTAVVMVGMVLFGGNKSGVFPTFPFAGGLTILLGASLMAAGLTLAGRRAALVLGILMFLAGAGLYVIGSLKDDPLFSILSRLAGVLVACLGGALAGEAAGLFRKLGK
jgi:hypothetical protein